MDWPGPLTARQYEAWQAWLDLQWNQPDRSDYYLMQIACVVAAANSKRPKSVKMRDFNLDFKPRHRSPKSKEQKFVEMQLSKGRWAAFLGTTEPPRPPEPQDEQVQSEEYVVEERVGE